jgi:hypothetical protein
MNGKKTELDERFFKELDDVLLGLKDWIYDHTDRWTYNHTNGWTYGHNDGNNSTKQEQESLLKKLAIYLEPLLENFDNTDGSRIREYVSKLLIYIGEFDIEPMLKNLESLLKYFNHPDLQVNHSAIEIVSKVLNRIGKLDIESLLNYLEYLQEYQEYHNHPYPQVLRSAIEIIGDTNTKSLLKFLDLLFAYFDHPDPQVRLATIEVIRDIANKSKKNIDLYCKSMNNYTRLIVEKNIQVITKIIDSILFVLSEILNMADSSIHIIVFEILINVGEFGIELLLKNLDHPNTSIRSFITKIICQIAENCKSKFNRFFGEHNTKFIIEECSKVINKIIEPLFHVLNDGVNIVDQSIRFLAFDTLYSIHNSNLERRLYPYILLDVEIQQNLQLKYIKPFNFVQQDCFLVARIDPETKKQELIFNKLNLQTKEIEFEDVMECIHTGITRVSYEEYAELIENPESQHYILNTKIKNQIVEKSIIKLNNQSAENIAKLNHKIDDSFDDVNKLDIDEKFFAFKSWVQGIAEAGVDALYLQTEIDKSMQGSIPIAQFLCKNLMKIDNSFLIQYIDKIERECKFEGVYHKASLHANLNIILLALGSMYDYDNLKNKLKTTSEKLSETDGIMDILLRIADLDSEFLFHFTNSGENDDVGNDNNDENSDSDNSESIIRILASHKEFTEYPQYEALIHHPDVVVRRLVASNPEAVKFAEFITLYRDPDIIIQRILPRTDS